MDLVTKPGSLLQNGRRMGSGGKVVKKVLRYIRQSSKHFTHTMSFNPHDDLMRWPQLFLLYR